MDHLFRRTRSRWTDRRAITAPAPRSEGNGLHPIRHLSGTHGAKSLRRSSACRVRFITSRATGTQTIRGSHRTLTIFTARHGRCHSLVSYIYPTVNQRSANGTRRWQLTIAIVAAMSLFVALIAGSSLRPRFSAAALPGMAGWTPGTHEVQAHAVQLQLHAAAPPISRLDGGLSPGSTPINKKPFHSMWMTRDRPNSWPHLSAQLDWLALPASFAASKFQPDGTPCAASAAASDNRDNLNQLCVIRC